MEKSVSRTEYPSCGKLNFKALFLAYKHYTLMKKIVTWFPNPSTRIRPEIMSPLKN